MMKGSVFVLFFLLGTALSAPVKVQEESETKFHGEDFHIFLPSPGVEITFRPSAAPRAADVLLMRGGSVVSSRAKLNLRSSHLVLDNVSATDEGVYTVKTTKTPPEVRRISLVVRDCSNEESVMYGANYVIPLSGVMSPITLKYSSVAAETNQTSRSPLVLLTSTGLSRYSYQGRISVNDRHVTLSTVTGADEGSYTVLDAEGVITSQICLNVKEHYHFKELPYDGVLKINLILNSSLVRLFYSTSNDSKPLLLMDKGELTSIHTDLGMEGRLYVEGSVVVLERVRASDVGVFQVIDLLDFPVAVLHLKVDSYRLPMVFVAVIALCGLLVFLLLVCLLSCLVKVKKRAKRAAALEKLAENAGKEDDGEAFRQVVKNITQLNEESKHSQADNTEKSQSTEVDIKGLEVSSKEVGMDNMETSDSGVGFNTTALPLDTDTDAADHILESEAVSISVAPETKSSPPPAAETKPSAPPATEMPPSSIPESKTSPVADVKASPLPETKKTPGEAAEQKLDVPKPGLSPVSKPSPDAKTPEPKPAPSLGAELKPTSPVAPSSPAAEQPKPTKVAVIPIINGTAEPTPGSEPDDLIGGSAPKAAPPKTPEVEVNSSGPALDTNVDAPASKDGDSAAATVTITTT